MTTIWVLIFTTFLGPTTEDRLEVRRFTTLEACIEFEHQRSARWTSTVPQRSHCMAVTAPEGD